MELYNEKEQLHLETDAYGEHFGQWHLQVKA